MSEITRILSAASSDDRQAAEQLLPLVYEELRRLAAARMARERPDHTLQPTALVHEAWLRLVGDPATQWQGRGHFFAAAAEAMRRILVDHARRKLAARHGGGLERTDWEAAELAATPANDQVLLAVHEALDGLARRNPRQAELVKLRYFAGLTLEEAAGALGISARTADNYWEHARAWLFQEIRRGRQ